MLQLGWATACSGVAADIDCRSQVRNGPPDAVRIRRATALFQFSCSDWKMAECSESTGTTAPPAFLEVSSRAGPAHTRLSLLARATRVPRLAAVRVGARPAAPTIDDITQEASMSAASVTAALPAAVWMPAPFSRSRSSGSRLSSSITAICGRQARACSARRSTLRPAVRATISTSAPPSRAWVSRSRVETPMEPVEPRTVTERERFNAATPD